MLHCRFPFRAARPSNAASLARQEREVKEWEDAQFAETSAGTAAEGAAAGVLPHRPFSLDSPPPYTWRRA